MIIIIIVIHQNVKAYYVHLQCRSHRLHFNDDLHFVITFCDATLLRELTICPRFVMARKPSYNTKPNGATFEQLPSGREYILNKRAARRVIRHRKMHRCRT